VTDSHDEWLKKQGVQVVSKQPVRQAFLKPIDPFKISLDTFDAVDHVHFHETQRYCIEVSEAVLTQWQKRDRQLQHIQEYAAESNSSLPYYDFYIKNKDRHEKLLSENPMYKQAWMEFQSIRALYGEDTMWP
jgi:hypothetical protein